MATIVVLDDEESIRTCMRVAFRMRGHTVHAFEDLQPSLEEVDFREVDLVITDLQMPTAIEDVIASIRKVNLKVPIVVMSGNIPDEVGERLNLLGVQETLTKPITIPLLFQMMERWVRE